MDNIKGTAALGRQAVIWSCVWLIAKLLMAIVALDVMLTLHALLTDSIGGQARLPNEGLRLIEIQGVLSIVTLVLFMVAGIVNACWIYRMVCVTRVIGDGVSITPGWAVGWFFVPLASLIKPFEAIREAWQVTIDPVDWPQVPVPILLRIWWSLWLAIGFVGYVAALGPRMNPGLGGYEFLSGGLLASGLIAIGLTIVWTRIVRHISRSQSLLLNASVFQ